MRLRLAFSVSLLLAVPAMIDVGDTVRLDASGGKAGVESSCNISSSVHSGGLSLTGGHDSMNASGYIVFHPGITPWVAGWCGTGRIEVWIAGVAEEEKSCGEGWQVE